MTLNPEAPQPNRLFQSSSLQAAKCANSMPTFSGNSGWRLGESCKDAINYGEGCQGLGVIRLSQLRFGFRGPWVWDVLLLHSSSFVVEARASLVHPARLIIVTNQFRCTLGTDVSGLRIRDKSLSSMRQHPRTSCKSIPAKTLFQLPPICCRRVVYMQHLNRICSETPP